MREEAPGAPGPAMAPQPLHSLPARCLPGPAMAPQPPCSLPSSFPLSLPGPLRPRCFSPCQNPGTVRASAWPGRS